MYIMYDVHVCACIFAAAAAMMALLAVLAAGSASMAPPPAAQPVHAARGEQRCALAVAVAVGAGARAIRTASAATCTAAGVGSSEHLTTISSASAFSSPGPVWHEFGVAGGPTDNPGWEVMVDCSRAAPLKSDDAQVSSSCTAPVVWVANSTQRVMNATAVGDTNAPTARVALAGNEYESVQVVIRVGSGCAALRVQVSVSALTSDTGETLDPVEWYQVGFVFVGDMSTGSGGRTKPGVYNDCSGYGPDSSGCSGYWPDPLLPVATATALPNFTSPLWFTVHAPTGGQGGVYTGRIQLSSPDEPDWKQTIPLQATVFQFSLPETCTFSTAVQLDYEMLERGYGNRAQELYPAFVKFAMQRLHVSPIGPYDSGLGRIQIGCCTHRDPVHTAGDIAMLAALGGGAAKALYAMPFNATIGCSVNASVVSAVEAANLSTLGYFYSFDEQKPSPLGFDTMRKCFQSLKDAAPGVRAATTAWIGTQYCAPGDLSCMPLDGATMKSLGLDVVIPQSNWGSNSYGANRSAVHKEGSEVWNYISLQPYVPQANLRFDNALIDGRSLMWQWKAVGADGFLYWSLNLWRTGTGASFVPINTSAPNFSPVLPPSQWNPHEGSYIWGDGKLLYFGVDGPLSSMRAENLRDSMEDMEILRLLDKVASPATAAALTNRVAVDTFLFSRNSSDMYSAKEEAMRLIEKAMKTDDNMPTPGNHERSLTNRRSPRMYRRSGHSSQAAQAPLCTPDGGRG